MQTIMNETLVIPGFVWNCDEIIALDDTLSSEPLPTGKPLHTEGHLYIEQRLGDVYYTLCTPEEGGKVSIVVTYEKSPHITEGDIQRLLRSVCHDMLGVEEDHYYTEDDEYDSESAGTLDEDAGSEMGDGEEGLEDNEEDDSEEEEEDDYIYDCDWYERR